MENPFIIVMFGATGDLAKNKLFPDLFALFEKNQLDSNFFIVGFGRREFDDIGFRQFVLDEQKSRADNLDEDSWLEFLKHIFYQKGDFQEENGYLELIEKLKNFDAQMGACLTRIFYLATPPENYNSILDYLDKTKLSLGCIDPKFVEVSRGRAFVRVAIEKPFGKDLESSKKLDLKLASIFEEKQIFRVDHYLGKETVQNMLVFRFANGLFEPIWNNENIDHVQITFFEKKGIGNRGKFFDGVGELRDIGQNHLMQLISSVIMESPKSFHKEDVRDARSSAIKSIKCIQPEQVANLVVAGQYQGYKDEKNVDLNSKTETFVAMKFYVESARFENVPFYVRTGKAMEKDEITISLVFKQVCHILFKEVGCPESPNILTFRIQPDEGIIFRTIAKKPGVKLELAPVDMHFSYKEQFKTKGSDAYEKIVLDIIHGDQMLFNRSDELNSSWEFITRILEGFKNPNFKVHVYDKGGSGPQEAFDLIEKDGRKWL